VRQTYNLQGLGKHSLDEQKQFAMTDMQAISDVVSQNQYIVGGRLTAYDFSVASMVSGILDNKPDTWLTEVAAALPALKEYAERVQTEKGIFGRTIQVDAPDSVKGSPATVAG